ncbi:MAG: CehA/McbA family metallohydrolase [Thermoleophilia bacterium]|nr:CehA/McbA family metallohydrolase [Thermoleophilia bacterium]
MTLLPFESPGAWLRCALHAHTTASDGELSPEALVAHYERRRFHVLAVTDHWVRSAPAPTGSLVVIPSVELDATVPGSGRRAHVLALGVTEAPERPDGPFPALEETVEWVNGHGGVAFLAHPYWSGLRMSDVVACDGLAGLEVYNAGCELEVGRGLASVHWDEALEAGRRWHALAVDDSHHPGFDSGHAWTWIRAAEASAAAVLAALREGSFYSSTGPRIEALEVEEGAAQVSCSPARRIALIAGPARGASVGAEPFGFAHRAEVLAEDDDGITAARLAIPSAAPYARLEVHGADGGTAWTNRIA